jgi:hypothetical protein
MSKKITVTEEEKKKQKGLKKKAIYTEDLIKIINKAEIKFYREVDIPKTETGITNKAKSLLKKYKEKLEKNK